MRAAWTALVAMAAGVWMGSCARPAATTPPPPPDVQEIVILWGQIRQWRHEARMDVEPAAASVLAMRFKTVGVAASACPDGHQVPPSCSEVCDPADAICDNAERICRLAGELTDTPWSSWARDKCDNAKGSCREAKQRCCGCERRAEVGP